MEKRRGIKIFITGIIAVLFAACSVEPKPIAYGSDHCEHCKMSIVDQRFGAEIVTDKGKIFTFDAIECMADYMLQDEFDASKAEYVMVTDYYKPGELREAGKSVIIQSDALKSPMGMNLGAFASEEAAAAYIAEHGGQVYSWQMLLASFSELSGINTAFKL